MIVERISLRLLITLIVAILGLLPVVHTFLMGHLFMERAERSHVASMQRVLKVATEEVMQQLRERTRSVAYELQSRGELRQAVKGFSRNPAAATVALNDPFAKGFAGIRLLDLVKLRLYDLELNYLAQSEPGPVLPHRLPRSLHRQAAGRTGADALKSVTEVWLHETGPYLSVLVPVGGLRALGYLEVVIDPMFSLARVESMVDMPLRFEDGGGKPLSDDFQADDTALLKVGYLLTDRAARPVLRLVASRDLAELRAGLVDDQESIAGSTATIALLTLLIALLLLERYVFHPIRLLSMGMANAARGSPPQVLVPHATAELRQLTSSFNAMARRLSSHTRKLSEMTNEDPLTGIANRRRFDQVLAHEWRRSSRQGTPLALILVDIDHFKAFNDSLGHTAGDECLRRVAQALEEGAGRASDLVARYGGEEFAIVLSETDADGARQVAERMMERIAALEAAHPDSPFGILTVSIGIASVLPDRRLAPQSLVERADSALYSAKANGRNGLALYEPDDFDDTSAPAAS